MWIIDVVLEEYIELGKNKRKFKGYKIFMEGKN